MAKTTTRKGAAIPSRTPSRNLPPNGTADVTTGTTATGGEYIVTIPAIQRATTHIRIVGTSPLIVHKWSAKMIKQIQAAQSGEPKAKKQPRKPEEEYEESMYRLTEHDVKTLAKYDLKGFKAGHPGVPGGAFKAAAVGACRFVGGLPMVTARGLFHVPVELVPIEGDVPHMRTDMVRLESGVADVRYRAEFTNWFMRIPVEYDAEAIQLAQLFNLFNHAGFHVGICEWRPMSKKTSGNFGRFEVDQSRGEER